MNWKKKFVSHVSLYFIGEILKIVASLISFPIFARILTRAEYGIMHIVTMTVELFILFGAAGLRPALFRFYSQYEKKSVALAGQLFATLFWATLGISSLGIVILNLVRMLPLPRAIPVEATQLLSLAAVLILFRTTTELIFAWLRIHEKPVLFLVGCVSQRYSGMLLAIYFIVYVKLRLDGFYRGIVLGEGIVFLALVSFILFQYKSKIFQFSKKIFTDCARYGFPLVGQNFSNFLNSVGDRYIILFFRGEVAVGIYSIGYCLADYIKALFVDTLEAALVPMTMNIAAKQGETQTKSFLTDYFSLYSLIAFPVIFGLIAVAKDAIVVIASSKFLESTSIVGYVIVGVMLGGSFFPVTIGLHLKKKTPVIAKIMLYAGSLNILLNLFMVPLWGITGAAIATLLSCLFQIIYGHFKSSVHLKVQHNLKFYFLCIVCAGLMFLTIKLLPFGETINILTLVLKILTGVIVYFGLLLGLDQTSRNRLKFVWKKIFNR